MCQKLFKLSNVGIQAAKSHVSVIEMFSHIDVTHYE